MIFLAFAASTWLAIRRAKAEGIKSDVVMDMVVWILISSLLGARLTYVVFHLSEFRGRWLDVISPIQSDGTVGIAGLVVLGGVALAIPVAVYFLKKRNIPTLKMLDILVPSLALGMAIGRVGCLLNGCCFGIPTNIAWGIEFPVSCLAGSVYPGEHLHPTQVYESLYGLAIMGVLLLRSPHRRFTGELFYLFLVLYGIARFFNETIRHYQSSMVPFQIGSTDITVSMLATLFMILIGLMLLIRGYKTQQGKT